MLVAAALVFASTRVGASESQSTPLPAVSQTAKHAAATGFASAMPAPATARTPAPARHTKRATHRAATHHASHKAKAPSAAAAKPAPAAAAKPAPKPAAQHSSDSGRAPATTHAQPPKPAPATPAPAALTVPADSGQTTVGGITFSVRAPSHAPRVGEDWTIAVAAARGAKPVTGKVTMDVIYQGKVGGHVTTARLVDGAFSKKIVWPARSVGYPLTMRIKLSGGGQRCTFLYDLKIQPAA
jgi:hypothetical protein